MADRAELMVAELVEVIERRNGRRGQGYTGPGYRIDVRSCRGVPSQTAVLVSGNAQPVLVRNIGTEWDPTDLLIDNPEDRTR